MTHAAGIVILSTCLWCVCCWRSHKARLASRSATHKQHPEAESDAGDPALRDARTPALGFVLHSLSGHSAPCVPLSTPRGSSGPISGPAAVPTHSPGSPRMLQPRRSLPPHLFHSVDDVPPRLYAHSDHNPDHDPDRLQWRLLQRSQRPMAAALEPPMPLRRSHSAGATLSRESAPRRPRTGDTPPARSFSAAAAPSPTHLSPRDRLDGCSSGRAQRPPLELQSEHQSERASGSVKEHDVVAAARINEEVRKMGRTLRESGGYTHFTIQSMVGRGAFGTVYRGTCGRYRCP